MAAPDPRFFYTAAPIGVDEACVLAGARLLGGSGQVTHASGVGDAQEGAVCFLEDAKSAKADDASGRPALVLTTEALAGAASDKFAGAAIGIAAKPKAAFARLAAALHRPLIDAAAPLSGLAETAKIAATAQVAPSAVVGEGALIHAEAVIGPFAVIGPGVVIGEGTNVGAHVSITHAIVGAHCRFAAGVRIGEAGFGYAPGEAGAVPVPQLGRVMIADRVDLGANTCVDRGALTDTMIGEGTKIDNLCQIAHGCRIGANVLIASQTGISGSVTVGDGVMIGGQAGMAESLDIGAGAMITARAGLMKDVPAGERWGGAPAKPARQWMKENAALAKLAAKKRET